MERCLVKHWIRFHGGVLSYIQERLYLSVWGRRFLISQFGRPLCVVHRKCGRTRQQPFEL